MDNKSIVLIVTSISLFPDIELATEDDMIIMISDAQLDKTIKKKINCRELSKKLFVKHSISNLILISKNDSFDKKQLSETVRNILLDHNNKVPLSLLLPYLAPPIIESRNDGNVQSCLISKSLFDLRIFYRHADSFIHLIYYLTYQYLNRNLSENIKVYQVGKPSIQNNWQNNVIRNGLKKALLIIPHRGSIKLLNRSLLHLNKTTHVPKTINLCFDEKSSHSKFNISEYKYLEDKLTVYLNNPTNVGPYLPRHYSVVNGDSKYVFFQDSDDISLTERFEKQIAELNLRKLDIIGSHKIRINQFSKKNTDYPVPIGSERLFTRSLFSSIVSPNVPDYQICISKGRRIFYRPQVRKRYSIFAKGLFFC